MRRGVDIFNNKHKNSDWCSSVGCLTLRWRGCKSTGR